MDTPIYDFVKEYAAQKSIRLHMPGHKGRLIEGFLGGSDENEDFEFLKSLYALDITEINGADVLYDSKGIIRHSEENAARLFGAGRTVYSAEGSSLSIRAMLFLISLYAASVGEKRLIAAGRNAHKSFVNAAALLDFDVCWLYSQEKEDNLSCLSCPISCMITPEELDNSLSQMPEKPVAVYITSPDYLGNIADIAGISKVCEKHGILLAIDNAHGAYLAFLKDICHPMHEGAHICCDSAHKTLPALTGGGYLHISNKAPRLFFDMAEQAMSLFASTSPSYLILASLDILNDFLFSKYPPLLETLSVKINTLKEKLAERGYILIGDEKTKLTIAPKPYGYTGYELADLLYKQKTVCEFADPDHTVMMFSVQNSDKEIDALSRALLSLPKRKEIGEKPNFHLRPKFAMSLREALLAPKEELDASMCLGRVLAGDCVGCPPAVAVAVCGETIDRDVIKCLEYYGIKKCSVVIK